MNYKRTQLKWQFWEKQDDYLGNVAQKFIDSDYNYKEAVIDIWMSSYYRAIAEDGATEDELLAGTTIVHT